MPRTALTTESPFDVQPTYQPVASPVTRGAKLVHVTTGYAESTGSKLTRNGTASVGSALASSRRAMTSPRAMAWASQVARNPPAPAAIATVLPKGWWRQASCVSPIGGGSHAPAVHSPRQSSDPGGSQVSPGSITPLPQMGRSQVSVHPTDPGGSHASPGSTVPSPQRGKWQVPLHSG